MENIIKREHNFTRTSWTSVVLSLLLLLCLGASAFAQALDQKKLDELVRKAETREAADGICARTGRPRGDSVEDFTLVLKRATVGSRSARTFSGGNCVVNSFTDVHRENGGKCVSYTF